jgi:serine/threonine-protein kinase
LETLKLITSGGVPRPSQIDSAYPPVLEHIVLKALERNPARRFQTAAEFEAELREFLKSERIVVPQSGVAGLLKRVMGARIEQRRRAVRKALKTLEVPESIRVPQLISHEPAFTPTATDEQDFSEVSNITSISNVSSLSQVGSSPQATSMSDLAPRSSGSGVRLLLVVLLMTSAILGYVVYETRLKAVFSRRDTNPTSQTPPRDSATRESARASPKTPPSPPATSASARVPTLSLDELDVEEQQPRKDVESGP